METFTIANPALASQHHARSEPDYRDLLIRDLSDEVHDLREANRQLIDLVADLAFWNTCLRMARDAIIARLQGELRQRLACLDEQP